MNSQTANSKNPPSILAREGPNFVQEKQLQVLLALFLVLLRSGVCVRAICALTRSERLALFFAILRLTHTGTA